MKRPINKKIDTGKPVMRVQHVTATDVISKGRPARMKDGRKDIAKTFKLTAANGLEVKAELPIERMEELHMNEDNIFCPDIVADKVLVACTIIFTREKDFERKFAPQEIPDFLTIRADIRELASLMGYPETDKGQKRAQEEIIRAANALYAWSFSCKHKGVSKTFHVFGGKAVTRNGILRATFTANYYEILAGAEGTMTCYPLGLFKLDRAPYKIGRQIALHVYRTKHKYIRDINGTKYNVVNLKVANLLNYGDLPDYNAAPASAGNMNKDDNSPSARAARDRGHWRERAMAPLEKAMDKLEGAGLLANWEYSHGAKLGKIIPITPEEVDALNNGGMDFETYSGLYISLYWKYPVDEEMDSEVRPKKTRPGGQKK